LATTKRRSAVLLCCDVLSTYSKVKVIGVSKLETGILVFWYLHKKYIKGVINITLQVIEINFRDLHSLNNGAHLAKGGGAARGQGRLGEQGAYNIVCY